MNQDYLIPILIFLVWVTGILFLYHLRKLNFNPKIALEHIDKYHELKTFLIDYQAQVRMFSICSQMHARIGEWSFEFVEQRFIYTLDQQYLCILHDGENYCLGFVPEDFPFEKIAEKKWK